MNKKTIGLIILILFICGATGYGINKIIWRQNPSDKYVVNTKNSGNTKNTIESVTKEINLENSSK